MNLYRFIPAALVIALVASLGYAIGDQVALDTEVMEVAVIETSYREAEVTYLPFNPLFPGLPILPIEEPASWHLWFLIDYTRVKIETSKEVVKKTRPGDLYKVRVAYGRFSHKVHSAELVE